MWLCPVTASPLCHRAVVSASTLAQCIGIDSAASGGQAQSRALIEQYITSVEAAGAKMNEVRVTLCEVQSVHMLSL